MQDVKDLGEIKMRIAEVEETILYINNKIGDELKKDFFKRRRDLCRFLDLEKKIHKAILKELNWVING